MARKLGQFVAQLDTPLMTTPVSVSTNRQAIGEWSPTPITGQFRVAISQNNPDNKLWLVGFLVWGPDGKQVTESMEGLAYSSSIGGLYSYVTTKLFLDITFPPGYFCTRINAMSWDNQSDAPITVRQLTLQRLIPIHIE